MSDRRSPQVGLVLAPDVVFLDLMDPVLRSRAVDYFSVTPETTWTLSGGALSPNGFVSAFESVAAGRPFVAHGVGLSVGSAVPPARRDRWLDRIEEDHRRWGFEWYTDHLGAHVFGERDLTLPVAVPWDSASAEMTSANLQALAERVPVVGVENSAFYFALDDPLLEPSFLGRVATDKAHVLLDLHNLYTNALNLGFSAEDWLARMPLERVIEIHVAGGREDPLGSGFRLDSHDAPVPQAVWHLLERVLPRCPNVRGVTLERREGSVTAQDVPRLEADLARIRSTIERCGRAGEAEDGPIVERRRGDELERSHGSADDDAVALRWLADALAVDRAAVVLAEGLDVVAPHWRRRFERASGAGLELTSQMVVRLRFERLMAGSAEAVRSFEGDPKGFSRTFRAYHHAVSPTAAFPQGEAELFAAFMESLQS